MANPNYAPLFDATLLKKIDLKIQKLATNQVKIFDEEKIKRDPYCNVVTSMARLVSTREICGGFHVINDKLSLSTNRDTRHSTLRMDVGKLICKMIEGGFKEADKLAIYKRCFKEVIKVKAKSYTVQFNAIKLRSVQDIILAKSDWETISLKDIAKLRQDLKAALQTYKDKKTFEVISKLKQDLETALKTHKDETILEDISKLRQDLETALQTRNDEKVIAFACTQLLIPLDDIDKICNELSKSHYSKIRLFIKEESFIRYNSANSLHAELAALQRDSQYIDLANLISQVSINTSSKYFTISKFCCYLCYLVFQSLEDCHDQAKNINFHHLGNSGIFYPGCEIPLIKVDKYSYKVREQLHAKLEALIGAIDAEKYKLSNRVLLENSEIQNLVDYELDENSEINKHARPTV